MTSDEVRERFLEFFEQREHLRLPSASLVPAPEDTSTLTTIAGMQPLKPYFQGRERPPAPRLASCQKVLRTLDIDTVGTTARHLTFFEMLGNFSIGDYFKQGAVEYAWDLVREGFGLHEEQLWITVFGGDEELGLGPDEEAIESWLSVGVPRERIVSLGREDNFWQSGPTGPCGPDSELYLDRGVEFGSPDDRPGGENARFLEFWNLVFMQYDQEAPAKLTPLPARNIDTGMGLSRMAMLLQGVPTIFDTDQFRPLIELGESMSGRAYGSEPALDRSLRLLADHSRSVTFLIADGVVPSNTERGYVLRRLMRRAIQHGRSLGFDPGFLLRYSALVRELMGSAYPELHEHRERIDVWLASEEEQFGHTLERGMSVLGELIEAARASSGAVSGEDAFRLHDTFGFPVELTRELVADAGLDVDLDAFEALMAGQRQLSKGLGAAAPDGAAPARERLGAFASEAGFTTRFVGYETTEQATTVGALAREDGRVLVKLAESPFYAAGGGQVSDTGIIECADGDCRARVDEVVRIGEDQALWVVPELGELAEGERVLARVDRVARRAAECNHTATHLLHAALRQRLGAHVHQAGSYVGPDKLRFDYSHGQALSAQELRDVEDQINAWVLENHPVRPITTTLTEARALGAMALFGEKYGDVVRMVEIGDGRFSRELCGGTHVRTTAEIGVVTIVSESSSAANVRRIEALSGPAALAALRERSAALERVAELVRAEPSAAAGAVEGLQARLRELERAARSEEAVDAGPLAAAAETVGGVPFVAAAVANLDAKALPDLADRIQGKLAEPAVIVVASGSTAVVRVEKPLAERVDANALREAFSVAFGGGGGGRATLARAGGGDPAKLDDAFAAARAAL
ncbi:MAG TPA: alanine--tRNA ligase, partial [Solirubrobacteraceae bacterium]|nr:alanine--tRNA ligase [Solirubrobacteraceae bacterium]